ncbi:hypothetical protein [Polaribacter tangerinus]|uniref:hypothetical protein n=1 Tax=Polaribacter tangerinus TaxID=1920034 RepID=UPI000B4B98A7|nr:hypothetical protein [Polaribacter tangerinus]
MDRNLNQEAFKFKENCLSTEISFDENDAQTLKKRQQVKEKLTKNTEITQDIDELLTSIEQYCFIILQSLN